MVNPLSRAALETRGILDHVVCNARARLGANNRKIKGGREASEEWLSIHASQWQRNRGQRRGVRARYGPMEKEVDQLSILIAARAEVLLHAGMVLYDSKVDSGRRQSRTW